MHTVKSKTAAQPDTATGLTARQARWLLYILLLGGTAISFSNSALNPAIPLFISVFKVDIMVGSWVLNAYVLAMSIGLMLTGYLNNRFASKHVYLFGMGCFVLGSGFGTVAQNMNMVIMARAIQGFAGGLIMPLSISMLYKIFPQSQYGRAMSIWGNVIMTSLAIGPLVGAYLINWLPWWILFLSTLPLALLTFILSWQLMPQKTHTSKHHPSDPETFRQTDHNFDWFGFVGLVSWLLMIMSWLYYLDGQSTVGFWLLGLVIIVVGLLWWSYERPNHWLIKASPKQPLLDLSLFDDSTYLHSSIISVSQTLVLMMCLLLVPIIVQQVMNESAVWTGIILMLSTLVASVTTHFAGKTVDDKGARKIGILGIVLSALSTGLIAWALVNPTLLSLTTLMMLRGLGVGLAYVPSMTVGLSYLPTEKVIEGASLNNISRRIFSTIGIALFTLYLDVRQKFLKTQMANGSINDHMVNVSDLAYIQTLQEIFVVLGLVLLVTIVSALRLPKDKAKAF